MIVDDFGVTLNPLLLAGQIHGGAAQGIGQALMEQAVYDPKDGQLVTGTLMDYALPRAEDTPSFAFETHNVPCTTNPLGVKGAGEAGTIGACPAVMNAVIDALWREYHIDQLDMPATPERVWVRDPRARAAAPACDDAFGPVWYRDREFRIGIKRIAGVCGMLTSGGEGSCRVLACVNAAKSEETLIIRVLIAVAAVAVGATTVIAQQDAIAARKALMKATGGQTAVASQDGQGR